MKISFLLALSLVATLLAGCGGGYGSCSYAATANQCIDYQDPGSINSTQDLKTALQINCSSSGGTYSDAACSTQNRIGRCEVVAPAAAGGGKMTYNSYSPVTEQQARTSCDNLGNVTIGTVTFIPG